MDPVKLGFNVVTTGAGRGQPEACGDNPWFWTKINFAGAALGTTWRRVYPSFYDPEYHPMALAASHDDT